MEKEKESEKSARRIARRARREAGSSLGAAKRLQHAVNVSPKHSHRRRKFKKAEKIELRQKIKELD